MKCANCGNEMMENMLFCPCCGNKANNSAPEAVPEFKVPEVANATATGNAVTSDANIKNPLAQFFENYGVLVLSICSLLVSWDMNIYYGMAMAVFGVILAVNHSKKAIRFLSLIFCGISLVLSVLTLFMM